MDHAKPGHPVHQGELLYMIKRVESRIRMHLGQVTRSADLTTQQYTALTVLERHPDQTASQLARHSFVTAQSAAEMVAGLMERGLVERHRDAADRRRLVIALTSKGQQVVDEIRPHVHDLEERMLTGLAPEVVTVLREALHSCDNGLNTDQGVAAT